MSDFSLVTYDRLLQLFLLKALLSYSRLQTRIHISVMTEIYYYCIIESTFWNNYNIKKTTIQFIFNII